MASHLDAPDEQTDSHDAESNADDRIDDHLLSAMESTEDDTARYHLREALQLQLAELHGQP